MAEPGFLYKVHSAEVQQVVVGQRCVEWEEPVPPPTPPATPDPPNTPSPLGRRGPTSCPPMKVEYYWDGLRCRRQAFPDMPSGNAGMSVPIGCMDVGYFVEDSYCGR